jgi:WD40 repeat protein
MKRVFATNSNNQNTKSSIYSSNSSLNSNNFNNNQQQLRAKSETPPSDTTTSFAGVHHIFNNHKGAVTRIRFANKDKSLLASCSLDGSLVICQVIPSPATTIYRLEGHQSGIMDMQWNTTNDLIVTASLDGTARVWQVNKGQCMRILKDTCGAQVLCCCFQPLNENMIFTGNSKGLIQVYNLSTGIIVNKNCLQKVLGRVLCMCFDSTGTNIWIGDDKGTLTAFQFDIFTLKLNKTKK